MGTCETCQGTNKYVNTDGECVTCNTNPYNQIYPSHKIEGNSCVRTCGGRQPHNGQCSDHNNAGASACNNAYQTDDLRYCRWDVGTMYDSCEVATGSYAGRCSDLP